MPERLVDINLLPKYERRGEGSSIFFFLFLLLTLAAFLSIGVFYYMYKGNLSDLEAEYLRLEAEEASLVAEVASLDLAEGESLKSSVQFAEGQRLETSKLITKLDQLLPKQAYLNTYTYRSRETTISTHLASLESVATYTSALTQSDFFQDVKLTEVKLLSEEGKEDGRKYYEADFTIEPDRQRLKKETKANE